MRRLRLPCLLLLSLLALASVASAGPGYIQDRKVTLVVWFDFNVSDLERWKKVFNDANVTLWRATNGRLQIGEVRFTTDVAAKATADIRVSSKVKGRAAVYGLKPPQSGLGDSACYTQLYAGDYNNAGTLVHELGHYVFSLRDEYRGRKWTFRNNKWQVVYNTDGTLWFDYTGLSKLNSWFCATVDTKNPAMSCIMDSSQRWKPGRVNFCLDGAHAGGHVKSHRAGDESFVNAQQASYGKACWTVIGKLLGEPPPSAPPSNQTNPTATPTYLQAAGNLFVIAIERDTALTQPVLDRLLKGASRALGTATVNTRFCVYAFDTSAVRVYGYSDMSTAALRAARTSIRTIKRSGTSGDLNWILATIRDDVAAQEQQRGQRYSRRTVLLLADGRGRAPSDAVLTQLRRNLVRVDTAAARQASNSVLLKRIASATMGRYRGGVQNDGGVTKDAVVDAVEQDAVDLAADAFGEDVLVDVAPLVSPGTVDTRTFAIDAYYDRFEIDVDYGDGTAPQVRLSAPDGSQIDLQNPPPQVTVNNGDGLMEIGVASPATGTWTVTVDGAPFVAPQEVGVVVVAEESPQIDVEADTENDVTPWPQAILVTASAEVDGGVPGATATATATAPDGSQSTMTLYDDGADEHGDLLAGDGVYSGYFTDARGPGVYAFDVEVRCAGGTSTWTTFDSEPSEEPLPPGTPVAPFVRRANVTAVLDGTAVGVALVPPAQVADSTSTLNEITLTWIDTNQGRASYVVQRSDDDGTTFRDYATVAAGLDTFTDRALDASSQVMYRIVARTAAGDSQPSDLVQIDMGAIDAGLASQPSEPAAQAAAAPGQSGGVAVGGGCFIATAAYGSSLDPHVLSLRRFRDDWLLPHAPGRWLVDRYYRLSPPIAAWLATHETARGLVRLLLWPVVFIVEHMLLVLFLLTGAMSLWVRRRRLRWALAGRR